MMASRFIFLFVFALMLAFTPVGAKAALDKRATPEEAVRLESMAANDAELKMEAITPEAGSATTETEGTEAHGEKSGGLPQLDIKTFPSQMFWLLVMFAVLYTAFSKSVLPAIGSVVHGREQKIKGDLAAAEALRHQAENVQAAYEKNLQDARAAALKAVQDVENAAKQKSADQMASFRQKSDSELAKAEENVNAAKDKALRDMNGVAAEVASIAAEKITGISTDVQKAHAIVESIAGKAKAA